MRKKIKKFLAIAIIFFIVFVRTTGPLVVLAQEADPTATPAPIEEITPSPLPTEEAIPTPVPDNSDSVSSPQATSEEPTPTPTSDPTSIEATNSAELNNNVTSDSNTGENTATQSGDLNSNPTTSELQTQSESTNGSTNGASDPAVVVDTGNAASVVVAENQVNTTVVNSAIYHHTLNLFISENGDLDLSDPFAIASNIITTEENSDSTVNVMATSVDNYATLSNDVVSIANTGANTIEGSMEATINTGDAISVVSLLNQVNFTIEGSTIHFVTINIFGKLTGNIILPEFSALESCNECGISVNAQNQATVNNNVISQANTGENTITYENNGSITTGDAASVVNLTNWINTNIVGLLIFNLVINVFGQWNGQFLGWGDIPAGDGSIFSFMSPGAGSESCCASGDLSISNQASVNNNILSAANSGGNSATGQNISINTGNAISIISLANFVNTNFIRSIGFFGFLNIFGEWNGNIGGKSKFITSAEETSSESERSEETSQPDFSRENGGQLSITNKNNVGEYVNPGDTVTFFIDVKNTGTGKVYDTKLHLFLVYEGKNVGGTAFNLGEIQPGMKSKVSTGFVLSKNAPAGIYAAVALATGEIGSGKIESHAQSYFQVGNGYLGSAITEENNNNDQESTPAVLGQSNTGSVAKGASAQNVALYALFIFFSTSYLVIRAIKKREYLAELFTRSLTFKERVYSFRLFLL